MGCGTEGRLGSITLVYGQVAGRSRTSAVDSSQRERSGMPMPYYPGVRIILKYLPGTDCRACGRSRCKWFAEDVASGANTLESCPHITGETRKEAAAALAAHAEFFQELRRTDLPGHTAAPSLVSGETGWRTLPGVEGVCYTVRHTLKNGVIACSFERIDLHFFLATANGKVTRASLNQPARGEYSYTPESLYASSRVQTANDLDGEDLEVFMEAIVP